MDSRPNKIPKLEAQGDTSKNNGTEMPSSLYPTLGPVPVPEVRGSTFDEQYEQLAQILMLEETPKAVNVDDDGTSPYDFSLRTLESLKRHAALLRQSNISLKNVGAEVQGGDPKVPSGVNGENKTTNSIPELNFQRVTVSGEDFIGDDPKRSVNKLITMLRLRKKYMERSLQNFHRRTSRFLATVDQPVEVQVDINEDDNEADQPDEQPYDVPRDPWFIKFLPTLNYAFKFNKGHGLVYKSNEDAQNGKPIEIPYPSLEEFTRDIKILCLIMADDQLKSFSFTRLRYLRLKYEMHTLFNEIRESTVQKNIPHKDFYNVQKVDNHLHAASCMNQESLLNFIRRKCTTEPDKCVYKDEEGNELNLGQILTLLNTNASDISVDSMDAHADRGTFRRFDIFNSKYNLFGDRRLREIFLKTDNFIGGKYFAEIIKEKMRDYNEKHQSAEIRLSVHGTSPDEWSKLARWAIRHSVHSKNMKFIVQVPRLYDLYKAKNQIGNFQDMLENIFLPLLQVTNDPNSDPDLHRFLQHVVAFDSVDNEGKAGNPLFDQSVKTPDEWNSEENPPYTYYIYYMHSNLAILNNFRRERGLNTFALRPHSGEAGYLEHLACTFLLAESIAHGRTLRKAPVLHYLFYLSQIGIAASPQSNSALYETFEKQPFKQYMQQGLLISLTTDDPLQFHLNDNALVEEFNTAKNFWQLSSTDLCELCRNSVLISAFPDEVKSTWIGSSFKEEGVKGNDVTRTNVPNVRVAYRYETLDEELTNLAKYF